MGHVLDALADLTQAEKLQLVEDLWDDIAANAAAIPVLDWQKEELDRRSDELRGNPGAWLTWNEVEHNVRTKHGR